MGAPRFSPSPAPRLCSLSPSSPCNSASPMDLAKCRAHFQRHEGQTKHVSFEPTVVTLRRVSMAGNINRQILLRSRPHGPPSLDNFELTETPMPEPGEGE